MPELSGRRAGRQIGLSLTVVGAGLLFGLALHAAAIGLRDYGPSGPGWSLRGNGALIVLLVAMLGLAAAEALCIGRRLWLAVVLLPFAVFAGLFLVAGSF